MKITIREKRFVVAGGAVVVLAAAVYFGDRLIPGLNAPNSELETKKQVLVKYRDLVRQEETYRARLEHYRDRLRQSQALLLPGDNPSIAGAELQRVLKEVADRNGVQIIRKDIQTEKKLQDNLIKISVRIEANCSPEQLVQFVTGIQNHEKYLNLDEFVINGYRIQKKYEIRPQLVVSGYLAGVEAQPVVKTASAAR